MFLNALLLYTHPTPQHTILHVFFRKSGRAKIGRKNWALKFDSRARLTSNQNTCMYTFILNTEHAQYTVPGTTIYSTVKVL